MAQPSWYCVGKPNLGSQVGREWVVYTQYAIYRGLVIENNILVKAKYV
jgi:hypothetical protein